MQISSIPTVAAPVAGKSGTATTNSAKPPQAAASSSAASGAAEPPKSAKSQPAAPQPQSEASAVSSATSTLPSSTYKTSVGGKSYSASISQANGTYTVSVPNLPGARVSAVNLSAAETALSVKIDTLA